MSSSRLRPELFVAGALLGVAFLLKQPAAIAAVPLGIYLLLPSYRASRSLTRINSIMQATTLTAGFFAVVGLVTIVLWKQGILRDAFYWTISDHDVPHVFWEKGILLTLAFIGVCLPLIVGVIMACRDKSEIWAAKTAERTALFGLLAASAIGTAAGARFYPHYYIQLIPPLCLLAAPYYARLWSRTIQPPYWFLRPKVTYAWLALTIVCFSIKHWTGLASRRVPSEDGTILVHAFRPRRQDFRLGPKSGNLSGRSQTSCLPLHHNLSADGLHFRRADPRFRYSQPDLARRLEHSRARFCQASANLHCRCSTRARKVRTIR